MAGVTKTGLFYYIDENTKHVYVEQKADPGTFAVLYGSPVEAVAWKADGKQVALLCKSDAATEVGVHQNKTTHTPSSEAKSVIRVFGVAGKECLLGDLLDELIIPEATELVWMTDVDYIVASKPQTFSTVVSVKGGKLKFSLRDDGVLPFAVKQTLALLNAEKQSVTFWDMQKNESVEVFNLPNRKARKGTTRTVSSTCSSGNFAFLMNDDATVHSACITKNAIAHLTPMLAHFSPFCRRPRKDEEVYAFEGSYRVMAHALPSNQVLVGVMGSPDIYKFEYHKQETALKPLEKLHIPHEEVLLALGADRYLALVRRDGQRTVMVRPLALGPLPQPGARQGEGATHGGEGEGGR
ncbi:hypothetical protein AGDE_11014 [Angomonas deanei]|nr:hypothetical protein AGDE_11014 [Angomonas deanei]|eukprot:EPY26943.1 hypothetical protein AGDE_11014 [Angomonas deanei]